MAKVHRPGNVGYTVKDLKRRHKRPCASAPNAPTGVTVTFVKREAHHRNEWLARVKWNGVTQDVAGRSINVEEYEVQLRATDASGVPVELDGGNHDFWRQRVPADSDLRAVFHPLPRPKVWYFQARVRVLNRIHGGKCWSAWSGWTTAQQPVSGALPGPPAPTGVTLNFYDTDPSRERKYHARTSWNEVPTWTPTDGDPLDGVARYDVQFQVSATSDVGGLIRTRRASVAAKDEDNDTTQYVDWEAIRAKHWYRTRVRGVDQYGRRGAWSAWTAFVKPSVTMAAPASVTVEADAPRRVDITWTPPASDAGAAAVDQYKVEVYQGANLKKTRYFGRATLHYRYAVPDADRGKAHSATVYAIDEDGNISSGTSVGSAVNESGTLDGSVITGGSAVDVVVTDSTADKDVIAELRTDRLAFDVIDVGTIRSDSVLSAGQDDVILYIDPVNGSVDNDGVEPVTLLDTFTRTVTDDWAAPGGGDTDSGHTWTRLMGAVADYDINGSRGTIVSKSTDDRKDVVVQTGGMHDELLLKFQVDGTPSGVALTVGALFRGIDVDNHYLVEAVIPNGGGTVTLQAREREAGTATGLVTGVSTGVTFAASTDYYLRAQCFHTSRGTILRAKFWLASGTEPTTWTLEHDADTSGMTIKAGRVGVHVHSGASLAAARTVSFDSVEHKVLDTLGEVVTGTGPLPTLADALARVPRYLAGQAYISSCYGATYDEGAVDISGFVGPGRLYVQGMGGEYGAGSSVLNGIVAIDGCAMFMHMRGWEIQDDGSRPDITGTVRANCSRHFELVDCKVQSNQANTARNSNVQAIQGSEMFVQKCQLDGSANNVASVTEGSILIAHDNKGTAGVRTAGYRVDQGIVFQDGLRPNIANQAVKGGQIFGSATATAGTAPSTSTKTTKKWQANKSGSWRDPSWGNEWRSDNDDVYQGRYQSGNGNHKGVWFYPSGVASTLSGKTIDAAYITVRRRAAGGQSAAQDIYVFSTGQSSPSGGEPNVVSGPTRLGALKWGETRRFKLPSAIANDLKTGKNLGLFQSDGDPYVICTGVKDFANSGLLEVTYH